MQCPKCGADLPAKAKFCLECGSNISAVSGASDQEQGEVSLGDLRTIAPEGAIGLGGEKSGTGLADGANFAERYELIEEIGRGGFAAVWKAKDKKLGRMVAVKKLHPEHDGMAASRFKREAQAIAQLNHRNIVQVYDVGEQAGEIWLVMELIEGGSLRDLLKQKGKLSLDEALPLFKGIAQGLAYAHRKNLVHRDIKPANILLASDDASSVESGMLDVGSSPNNRSPITDHFIPKIVDFGLAQAGRDSELSMSGYGMGTPYYMPPEQRRDAKSVNHTADIYALGKVLYELVSGEIPDNVDPDLIPPPPELSQIIFKCIKSKPEDRYFSVDELLRELEGIGSLNPSAQSPEPAGDNACPACGAKNGDEVEFCSQCGTGLMRSCPECGKKNLLNTAYCPICGTDVEGFLVAQNTLSRMENYAADRKWSRVVKEAGEFKDDVRLPGKKGAAIRISIDDIGKQSGHALSEIERLEKIAASPPTDAAQVRSIAELSRYKTLPENLLALDREARARIAEQRREKARKTKRWLQKAGIGIVACGVLFFLGNLAVGAVRKSAFHSAVAARNLDRAQAMAQRIGSSFKWGAQLSALDSYTQTLHQFNEEVLPAGDLLKRFGGEEWKGIQELMRQAEKSRDIVDAAEKAKQALDWILKQKKVFSGLISARQRYDELAGGLVTDRHISELASRSWQELQQELERARDAEQAEQIIKAYERAYAIRSNAVKEVQAIPARLMVESNIRGAEVFDAEGKRLGVAGTAFDVPSLQPVSLVVRAKGYASKRVSLEAMEFGKSDTHRVTLEEWTGPEAGQKWTADLGGGVSMDFMPIAAGSFQMGSNNGESYEKPVHTVRLSQPFWMAKTEVTQAQYEKVMGSNPSKFKGAQNPVEQVRWNDAMNFCKKLTDLERQAGRLPEGFEYTLPTEAQWEYACRAGTTGDYAGSLDSMGWYDSNSGRKTHSVGTKQANAWGLHDMHGNVWEWCSDWFGSYGSGSVTDPRGASSGSYRIFRGGSWYDGASNCRSAVRFGSPPSSSIDALGFRACLVRK